MLPILLDSMMAVSHSTCPTFKVPVPKTPSRRFSPFHADVLSKLPLPQTLTQWRVGQEIYRRTLLFEPKRLTSLFRSVLILTVSMLLSKSASRCCSMALSPSTSML